LLSQIYVSVPKPWFVGGVVISVALFIVGTAAYLAQHPRARRLVWPEGAAAL
jgi:hypothetical protein